MIGILLMIGAPYIKVEILTLMHGSEFAELYDASGWMNDMTYLKVYHYSLNEATVYYADLEDREEGSNATFLYHFSREDGEWNLQDWKCIWSESGNADEWIWPYYGHHRNFGVIHQEKDPRICIEEKLGIELGEGVTLVEGEAYHDNSGEECVRAKFKVESYAVDSLRTQMENCLWKYEIEELEEVELQHVENIKETWMDLADKKILDFYEQDREGKKSKTINILAFLVTDDEGEYYLYIHY